MKLNGNAFWAIVAIVVAIAVTFEMWVKHTESMKELELKYNVEQPITNYETITENGDTWHSVGDTIYGAEWRHLTSDEDSMAVVHIWQNGRLNTWIGKPCNCY